MTAYMEAFHVINHCLFHFKVDFEVLDGIRYLTVFNGILQYSTVFNSIQQYSTVFDSIRWYSTAKQNPENVTTPADALANSSKSKS